MQAKSAPVRANTELVRHSILSSIWQKPNKTHLKSAHMRDYLMKLANFVRLRI